MLFKLRKGIQNIFQIKNQSEKRDSNYEEKCQRTYKHVANDIDKTLSRCLHRIVNDNNVFTSVHKYIFSKTNQSMYIRFITLILNVIYWNWCHICVTSMVLISKCETYTQIEKEEERYINDWKRENTRKGKPGWNREVVRLKNLAQAPAKLMHMR